MKNNTFPFQVLMRSKVVQYSYLSPVHSNISHQFFFYSTQVPSNDRVTWKQLFKVDKVNLTNWVTCNWPGLTKNYRYSLIKHSGCGGQSWAR